MCVRNIGPNKWLVQRRFWFWFLDTMNSLKRDVGTQSVSFLPSSAPAPVKAKLALILQNPAPTYPPRIVVRRPNLTKLKWVELNQGQIDQLNCKIICYYSLLATFSFLLAFLKLASCYLPLVTCYMLLPTCLLATYYLLPATSYLLLSTSYLLFSTYYLLIDPYLHAACYLLLAPCFLPLDTCLLLLTTCNLLHSTCFFLLAPCL